MSPLPNAIEIRNLNKTYRSTKTSEAKIALKDVSLDIPKGSMFALLGPNGAGKSTMINISLDIFMKKGKGVHPSPLMVT